MKKLFLTVILAGVMTPPGMVAGLSAQDHKHDAPATQEGGAPKADSKCCDKMEKIGEAKAEMKAKMEAKMESKMGEMKAMKEKMAEKMAPKEAPGKSPAAKDGHAH